MLHHLQAPHKTRRDARADGSSRTTLRSWRRMRARCIYCRFTRTFSSASIAPRRRSCRPSCLPPRAPRARACTCVVCSAAAASIAGRKRCQGTARFTTAPVGQDVVVALGHAVSKRAGRRRRNLRRRSGFHLPSNTLRTRGHNYTREYAHTRTHTDTRSNRNRHGHMH